MENKRGRLNGFLRRPAFKVYILLAVSLVLASVFFKDYFSRPRIRGGEDLVALQGTVTDWWYVQMGNETDWSFEVKEYRARFKIPGRFFGFAYSSMFKNNIAEGSVLQMRIARHQEPKLSDEYELIDVIGLWDEKHEYVDKDKALTREMRPTDLYMALGALGAALFFGLIIWFIERQSKNV